MFHVIIPAYNEEKNVGQVVESVLRENPGAQAVVVDDGSSDNTAELARQAGAVVLRHLVNRGQGAALQTGTEFALKAGAQVIAHFDGDGQFEAGEIRSLIEPILRGEVDVVLGSRFLTASNYKLALPWTKKYLILPLARLFNFFLTGAWLSDAHNGFRAFSARAARLINIEEDRMAHGSEILEKIITNQLKFKEVPVTVHYRRYGQGMAGGLIILKDLFIKRFMTRDS